MLPYPINLTQVDARSPVDDNLMTSIKYDLEYLDGLITGGSSSTSGIVSNVEGVLECLKGLKRPIDTSYIAGPFVPSVMGYSFKRAGISGFLKFQMVKKANYSGEIPIRETFARFTANIQAVTRTQTALNIQSIQRAEASASTQSIAYAYAAKTVSHVLNLGDGTTQYVIDSNTSVEWAVGDTVVITGCTTSANNGRFPIVAINQGNKPCLVVTHGTSVTETTGGSVNLAAFRYTTTNPVAFTIDGPNTLWVMASHTDSGNNGTFAQFAHNIGGNGPVIKNAAGVTQGGAVGNVAIQVWRYTVDTFTNSRLAAGEKILNAGCANSDNDGVFTVLQSNGGGGTIDVLNTSGAAQGSAVGTTNFYLWSYALDANPTTNLTAGTHKVSTLAATDAGNIFTAKLIRERTTSPDVIVVYNEDGTTQGSAAGTLTSSSRLIEFSTNQSSLIRVGDLIEIDAHLGEAYNQDYIVGPHQVVAVNQMGGFNAEIETEGEIAEWAGMVSEVLHPITPVITHTATPIGTTPRRYTRDTPNTFTGEAVNNNDLVFLYIRDCEIFDAEDLTVTLK